jgi:hypothetical protein
MTRLVVSESRSGVLRGAYSLRRADQVEVIVDVDLDQEELRRRARINGRPILNLELLNLLVTMSPDVPVRAGTMSDYEIRLLRAGDRIGAAELTSTGGVEKATRLAMPPLTVQHVTVVATDWRTGVRVASRFAPYGSREVILDRPVMDETELLLEATYLGVGISVGDEDVEGSSHRVLDAAPFTPARYTGASWLFAEQLLASQPHPDV